LAIAHSVRLFGGVGKHGPPNFHRTARRGGVNAPYAAKFHHAADEMSEKIHSVMRQLVAL